MNNHPFEHIHCLRFINVVLDERSVIAMVDSGAEFSTMSLSLAKEAGLEGLIDTRNRPICDGTGGSALILGTIHLYAFKIGNERFDSRFQIMSISYDIILGMDFFRRYNCIIDLAKSRLTINDNIHEEFVSKTVIKELKSKISHNFNKEDGDLEHIKQVKKSFSEEDMKKIPYSFKTSKQPFVWIVVNGVLTLALIDSGAQISYVSFKFAVKAGLRNTIDSRYNQNVVGNGGIAKSVGALKSGVFKIGNNSIDISFNVLHSVRNVVLGLDFLIHYKCAIDFVRNRLIFNSGNSKIHFDLISGTVEEMITDNDFVCVRRKIKPETKRESEESIFILRKKMVTEFVAMGFEEKDVEEEFKFDQFIEKTNLHRMRGGHCFSCKRIGHFARDCPTKKEPHGEEEIILRAEQNLFKCGKNGHASRVCVEEISRSSEKRCFKCRRTGHISRNCTVA